MKINSHYKPVYFYTLPHLRAVTCIVCHWTGFTIIWHGKQLLKQWAVRSLSYLWLRFNSERSDTSFFIPTLLVSTVGFHRDWQGEGRQCTAWKADFFLKIILNGARKAQHVYTLNLARDKDVSGRDMANLRNEGMIRKNLKTNYRYSNFWILASNSRWLSTESFNPK